MRSAWRWPRRSSPPNSTAPLLRQVDRFGRVLALVIIGLSVLTFALGTLWRGHGAADMFMMVVALAASAIPEGLPAIMTVTLAMGVQRMARHQARELLMDPAGYPHGVIAEMVNARIEGAQASAKSVRWYAHDMRKKGTTVPERQRVADNEGGEEC